MQGEAARGWNPDPQRAPAPPVITRRVHSQAPDPGTAGDPLPPFRASSAGPLPADLHAVRMADRSVQTETQVEPDGAALDHQIGRIEPTEHAGVTELEEVLLLEEVVSGDVAQTGLESVEPGQAAEISEQASLILEIEPEDAGEVDVPVDAEATVTQDPAANEEPWDPLGDALRQAVAQANPALAEDLVRSAEPSNRGLIEEMHGMAPATRTSYDVQEAGEGDADVAARVDRRGVAERPAADLSEDLAATLESLAGKLRTRGFNGLDDAFTRGGRLESSLALFLAGYRAGLDE